MLDTLQRLNTGQLLATSTAPLMRVAPAGLLLPHQPICCWVSVCLQLWEQRYSHRGTDLPPALTAPALEARRAAGGNSNGVRAEEVIDLTSDDVEMVDVEAWVLECLVVGQVKVERVGGSMTEWCAVVCSEAVAGAVEQGVRLQEGGERRQQQQQQVVVKGEPGADEGVVGVQ